MFISHVDNKYFLDINFNFYTNLNISKNYFLTSFLINYMIILNYFCLFLKKYKNNFLISIFLLVILYIFLYIFFLEFSKYMYVSSYMQDMFETFNKSNKTSHMYYDYQLINLKLSNITNFYLLIFILKFIHVIFIYFFFNFVVNNYLYFDNASYNLLSSNLLNFLFLFAFNLLTFLFLIKY